MVWRVPGDLRLLLTRFPFPLPYTVCGKGKRENLKYRVPAPINYRVPLQLEHFVDQSNHLVPYNQD